MSNNLNIKSLIKVFAFLGILTVLDFAFRKGFFGVPIPMPLPSSYIMLLFYSVFAIMAGFLTKRFARRDQLSLADLGISFSNKNRLEFFYGLLVGILLWGIVSIVQSLLAGFSWILRPNIGWYNILYGLFFIFIADLGTELFTRGYPLVKLKDRFGANIAIVIMVFFVGLISISMNAHGELLLYIILIPALHTLFFSIIYFKTKRLGGALGVHTGANFVTISIFDLREVQEGQVIPSGIFQADASLDTLSLTALQMPWVIMAVIFSFVLYFWWKRGRKNNMND